MAEIIDNEKSHWYSFAFVDSIGYKSTYIAFDEKDKISSSSILFASEQANCTEDGYACLGVSYLGYMTKEEFDDE